MKSLAIALAMVAAIAVGSGFAVYYSLNQAVTKDAVFEIPRGDNLSSISKRLQGEGLLPAGDFLFKAYALYSRDEGAIQAGQFQITSEMSAIDVLALFRSGKVIQHRVTFPEGWSLQDWLSHLQQTPHLRVMSNRLSRGDLSQVLEVNRDLEGLVFPDTYQYIKDEADLQILKVAFDRMEDVLKDAWFRRVPSPGIETPYDALILASIIEKETAYEPDREKVASVFLNRLARGMKLQSDPTVIYGLGDQFDGDLTRQHLRSDTPYNTYTRYGLPPTPICAPGRASIEAALAGSNHPYLFFVAKGDGKSHFSTTYEEHDAAVDRYQRQ